MLIIADWSVNQILVVVKKRSLDYRSCTIAVVSYIIDRVQISILIWQVGMWLLGLQLDEYCNEFAKERIDGKKLLAIDNSKLKVCSFETCSNFAIMAG